MLGPVAVANSRNTEINSMLLKPTEILRVLASSVLVLVTGCGGGEGAPTNLGNNGTSQGLDVKATSLALQAGVRVTGITKLSEVRISRTVFQYVFSVQIVNGGTISLNNVAGVITSAGPGTRIIKGSINVGALLPGTPMTALDSIVIQQDRTVAFDANALQWQFTSDPATFQTSPLLDNSVPPQASGMITSIASATASATPSDTIISVPFNTSTGDSAVIATTAAGDVVLIQFVKPGQPISLSVSSTASAMGRIALGNLAATVALTAQVDQAVLFAPEYSNLQSQISSALTSGISPATSTTVLASLSTLAIQAKLALGPVLAIQGAPFVKSVVERISPLGSTPPPLPYTLLPGGVFGAVSLIDDHGPGIQLNNYSLVAWSARTSTVPGAPTGNPTTLPPLSVLNSFIGVAKGSPVATPTPIPAFSNPFVVAIRFDADAQAFTIVNILVNEATIALNTLIPPPFNVLPSCVANSLSAVLNPGIAALVAAPSLDSTINFVKSFGNTPVAAYNTLQAVATCASKSLASLNPIFIGPFGKLVSAIQLAVTTTETVKGVQQFYTYLAAQPTPSVEVCKSSGTIIPCALDLQVPNEYIAIGQVEQATAVDATGSLVTTGLVWDIFPDSSSGSVLPSSGLISANFPGQFEVRVSNKYSDVGLHTLTTYVPVISPNTQITLAIKDSIQLTLVDPLGATAILSPRWLWSSATPTIATVDQASGVVTGLLSGVAQINVTDPTTGTVLLKNIQVSGPSFVAIHKRQFIDMSGHVSTTNVEALVEVQGCKPPVPPAFSYIGSHSYRIITRDGRVFTGNQDWTFDCGYEIPGLGEKGSTYIRWTNFDVSRGDRYQETGTWKFGPDPADVMTFTFTIP